MKVLVSGAGIAGTVFAWHLVRALEHAHATILEKNPGLIAQGQNIDINFGALDVIKGMGLLDEIRKLSTNEQGTRFLFPNGSTCASFPMRPGFDVSPTSEHEILRGDLAVALLGATKDHPRIDYQMGVTVGGVVTNDDQSVKVSLSNGEEREYDLLVLADGQWSKLRKQNFPEDSVKVVSKNAFVAYWTTPRLPSDDNWWSVYPSLGSRVLSLRPDPHGTMRAMAALMPRTEQKKREWREASRSDRQTQEDLVRRELKGAGWQVERLVASMPDAKDFYFQAVEQIRLDKWHTKRIVCVGDAAYAPTPFTGMGCSLAIMGGYILAGEVGKLKDGQHPSTAFEAYEANFKPFVQEIQDIPSFIPGIMLPEGRLHRCALLLAMGIIAPLVRLLSSIPWLWKRLPAPQEAKFMLPNYEAIEAGKGKPH